MKLRIVDNTIYEKFPPPPIEGSELLVPIRSWPELFCENLVTKVEFDEFWEKSVEEGVAYFFSWFGEPRATVLVIWDEDYRPTHIESRKIGGSFVYYQEAKPIQAEVEKLFREARPSSFAN